MFSNMLEKERMGGCGKANKQTTSVLLRVKGSTVEFTANLQA